MSQKLSVNDFKWVKTVPKIDEDFIKSYDNDGDIGYFLDVDIEYPRELRVHSDLPVLPEKMKISKCSKLVCTLHAEITMLSI